MTLLTAPRARVKPSVILTGPEPRHRRRRPRRAALGLLLVGLVASGIGITAPTPPTAPAPAADAAARRFLDTYAAADGRVVRSDTTGDTVSEGQAHALLLAVALDDRATFDRVWDWTAAHLQRPGGLLARRWAGGRVRDAVPDTAADTDTAHALLLAADRFDDPHHLADGLRITGALRRARARATAPSTIDPRAFSAFEATSGQRWWGTQRAAGITSAVRGELNDTDVVRLAAGCDGGSVAAAAARWPALEERAGRGASAPVLVAAAAAAGAAGHPQRRADLLDRAEAVDAAHPSHDGLARIALGRVLLTTSELGTC